MSTARLAITPDSPPDPNATPRVDIVDGPNGGVKVDPALTPAPADKSKGERPSWLPAQFETPEAFAASYTELRTKMDAGKPAAPAATVTPEAAVKAGIDLPALAKEFAETGELSAETLNTLKEKGFDQAAVDSYIAGQTAISEKLVSDLQAVAGGKEKFTATIEWAAANLSAEDKAAYNAAVDSGDVRLAKLALQGVVAQYTEANGSPPSLIEGGEGSGSSGVAPYASNAQVVADMSTKAYKTDPAFRAKVAARLAVTPAFGS
jgi:hypothetical protein